MSAVRGAAAAKTILVVANETLGGRALLDAITKAAEPDVRFILCVPQNRPRSGLVIYDDVVFDAAQIRVDLALEVIRGMDIRAIGEVGDPDPFTATMDAVHEYHPQEIIVSTLPGDAVGVAAADLIERLRERPGFRSATSSPTSTPRGSSFHVTLAVANRTASGDELLEALREKAEEFGPIAGHCSSC